MTSSSFHVGVPKSAFQAPVPVQVSTMALPIGMLALRSSALGISALRSSAPVQSFLPTPSPAWQQIHKDLNSAVERLPSVAPRKTLSAAWKAIHAELEEEVSLLEFSQLEQQEQQPPAEHKTSMAKVLVEFFDQLYQRQNDGKRRQDHQAHYRKLIPVIREFAHAHHKRTKVLTLEDKSALRFYCNNAFWKVNTALRSKDDDAPIQQRIRAIQKALRKRQPFQGTCYRGSDLPVALQQSLQVGATFQDEAFLSTARQRHLAFGDKSPFHNKSFFFVIQSQTGVSVQRFSKYDEDEILFQPKTTFRVLKVDKRADGKTMVHMKEMV